MIKLIKHTGECDYPDDESLPIKLELYLRAPEFMAIAFIMIHGGSEVVVARAETVDEIDQWMKDHRLETHPRLSRFRVTQGADVVRSHNWAAA